jgi:hypothetical protein
VKNYRILTILVIPYLTVCGGLYHLAYWGTFNINGPAYIGLYDLIKSFVHPFFYFFIIALLSFIVTEGIFHLNKVFPHGKGRNTPLGKKLNSKWGISISLIIWLSTVILLYSADDVNRWLSWAFIVGIVPMLFLDRLGLWLNEFDDKLRIHAIRIFVFIPILSFASGKYQSELIYKNIQYQYTTSEAILPYMISSKIDTLKFLGNVEHYIILTNLKNSKIILVNNDKLEVMQLKQKYGKGIYPQFPTFYP